MNFFEKKRWKESCIVTQKKMHIHEKNYTQEKKCTLQL